MSEEPALLRDLRAAIDTGRHARRELRSMRADLEAAIHADAWGPVWLLAPIAVLWQWRLQTRVRTATAAVQADLELLSRQLADLRRTHGLRLPIAAVGAFRRGAMHRGRPSLLSRLRLPSRYEAQLSVAAVTSNRLQRTLSSLRLHLRAVVRLLSAGSVEQSRASRPTPSPPAPC